MRRPSGDGLALRICRTSTSLVSTRVGTCTTGPSCCSTLAVNGISVACPDGTATRQILPPYETTSAWLSGVNDAPGYRSREPRLLIVACHGIDEPLFVTRRQVSQAQ